MVWASRGRILVETKDLSLLQIVQTGSGVNPASYSMGVGVISPAMNHLGREVDHWPPHSAEVKNESSSTYTPPFKTHGKNRLVFRLSACRICRRSCLHDTGHVIMARRRRNKTGRCNSCMFTNITTLQEDTRLGVLYRGYTVTIIHSQK